MSTIMMIGAGILTWVLVAILTALMVGKVLQRRDAQRPVEPDPLGAQAPVPSRRLTSLRRTRR
ncbi:MAG: hypothetical protein ACRDRX_17150 [Pseudonocardiaceae bacterium]